MKEKLIIKNFGGLEYVEFDFQRINIFIGPQAAGKSVVLKLVYLFRSFFKDLGGILRSRSDSSLNILLKNRFCELFPPDTWGMQSFMVRYQFSKSMVIIECEHIFDVLYSQDIKDAAEKYRNSAKQRISSRSPISYVDKLEDEWLNILEKDLLYDKMNYNNFFIPSRRNIVFYNLQVKDDAFLNGFKKFYEEKLSKQKVKKEDNDIMSQILKADYFQKETEVYLTHGKQMEDRVVSLKYSSSGQQESLPLLLSLINLKNDESEEYNGQAVYLEEPEVHLFPTAQKKVVELLAQTFNSKNKHYQFFITTHSPYILSSFNNLIEAGNAIKAKPDLIEDIYKIISKEKIIYTEDIITYALEKGKARALIDKKTGLINDYLVDSVSDEILKEYDQLLEIIY